MKSECVGIAALACMLICGFDAHAVDVGTVSDPAGYVASLRELRLVDDTLRAQVSDVVSVLVARSGRWSRGQVNGRYDSQGLNVYLLDVTAPGAKSAPDAVAGLRGTLQALPAQRMVLVDARYLAEIKVATQLYMHSLGRDRSVKAADVLVAATIEGPDEALGSRLGNEADWRGGTNEIFDGAVAFLVAHEMGHLAAGVAPASTGRISIPQGLRGRDRDRFWACSSLVGDAVNSRRREEAQADAFAAELLGSIPHLSARRLRYEHGTMFLHGAELGKVAAALAALTSDDSLARAPGFSVNPATVRAMAGTLGRGTGLVQTAFPEAHPAQAERLLDIADGLARNPRSTYYGDSDGALYRSMLSLIVRRACAPIESAR